MNTEQLLQKTGRVGRPHTYFKKPRLLQERSHGQELAIKKEFTMDSGASMHMMSKSDLNHGGKETIRKS